MLGGLHIHICSNARDVLADWQSLEGRGVHTYFQNRAWCLSWVKAVATEIHATPLYALGRSADGTAVFLLPLQIRHKHGFKLLEFLTAPHASYGFGLFDTTFLERDAAIWFEHNFDALLALLPPYDIAYLRDLPGTMLGHLHPLLAHSRFKGANRAYMMALDQDFDKLLSTKRSHDTLRSMRKRDKRLMDMGDVRFGAPTNNDERKRVLECMFTDHELRLAETGVHGVYGPIERGFLSGLADPIEHGAAALIPYTLMLNGKPICVLLGGRSGNVFWAMITSLADGNWRKHSPGDYTLRHVIAAQCVDGISWFDFAVGDSDYKLPWADTIISMNLILRARTFKGYGLGLYLILKHGVKRLLKENATLRDFAFTLRRIAFGRRR